jgi:outer membrane protein
VKVKGLTVVAGLVLLASASAAMAEAKIGFVNSDKVLREAAPAVRTQKRLEKEFEKREQDLQRIAGELKAMQENLEKNGMTLPETDRKTKEREFNELNREFQRRQREFREDLNQRRNEELASLLDKANKAVKQIAEAEKFDIIFQEAVYFNPRIDITDKVIKALADTK